MTATRILFVGDVVGRPGRRLFRERLPGLRRELEPALVVVNGENAAGGNGITPEVAAELREAGADVVTLGNHAWDKREILPAIDELAYLVRPLNFPPGTPGRGSLVAEARDGTPVLVVNAMGRVFLGVQLDDPFRAVDEELARHPRVTVRLVDFHAEATSEKIALAWHLRGRVSAVIGTHTHVQTADEAVLPGGTAYISDAGMTGPWLSVLGVDADRVVQKFLTQMPVRFDVARGPGQFDAVVVDVDRATGRALAIGRIHEREA
ncbi:MAG: TIGR00282 family metallophosphoesterase [Clostridia bacterium]|nr:TIGR00282 family metallophosphoesterase [Clostridia bacterium]